MYEETINNKEAELTRHPKDFRKQMNGCETAISKAEEDLTKQIEEVDEKIENSERKKKLMKKNQEKRE